MDSIGIIGLGRMGSAMATRLCDQGLSVTGWTRSGRAVDGIAMAANLEALAAHSDILLLSLYDNEAVSEVLDALLAIPLEGKLIIETSTVVPSLVKTRAARIVAAGAGIVDAPVSGGPELVASGTCGIFIGGDPGPSQRAATVLAPLSNRIFHVGPLGAGLVMKTINNAMIQVYIAGLTEQLRVARRAGLPLDTALTILCGGPAGTPIIRDRIPNILGTDPTVGFTVSGMAKDHAVFRSVAGELGVDTPALAVADTMFKSAIHAGLSEADGAAILTRAYHDDS